MLSTLHALMIAFALVGYPFVATLSTALGLSGTPLAIVARAVVLILSLMLIVPAISRIQRHHLKYLAVFATFWMAYLMRMAADTTYYAEQLSKAASEYWIWALGVCLIPALALMGVSAAATMPKAFKLTWLALGASAGLTIVFGSTIVTHLGGIETDTGRLALESLNPTSIGHMGASLVIFSGWYWLTDKGHKGILKTASLLGMLAGGYLLLSSASRGPLIAFICVIAMVLLTLKVRKIIKISIIVGLIAAALLPIVFSQISLESLALAARIVGSTSGEDLSIASRQASFDGAWNQFLSNPLFGDFLEERSTGFYPHNLVLEAFMATGLIGGLSFLAISIVATWKAFRLVKLKSNYAWAGLIYIQYFVGAQFSGSIFGSSIFWVFSVLVIFTNNFDHVSRGVKNRSP